MRSLAWLADDTKLVSAGVDGAVYEWRLKDFKRSKENVLKVRPMQISSTNFEPAVHSVAHAVEQHKSRLCSAWRYHCTDSLLASHELKRHLLQAGKIGITSLVPCL